MSEVKFYVNSLSKKQLAEAYIHLRSRLERLEEKSARLERRAKDCDGCAKQIRRIKVDGEFPKGHTIYIGKCRFVAESDDGWFYPQQLRDGTWEGWR